jgi:hypothetical protein
MFHYYWPQPLSPVLAEPVTLPPECNPEVILKSGKRRSRQCEVLLYISEYPTRMDRPVTCRASPIPTRCLQIRYRPPLFVSCTSTSRPQTRLRLCRRPPQVLLLALRSPANPPTDRASFSHVHSSAQPAPISRWATRRSGVPCFDDSKDWPLIIDFSGVSPPILVEGCSVLHIGLDCDFS